MAASSSPRRVRLVVTGVLVAILVAGFSALGTWQVQRRAWKLALIDKVETRVHAPAVAAPGAAPGDLAAVADGEYRHVAVEGTWLPDTAAWVQASTDLGSGYWLLMALRPADGRPAIYVNRGFVPPDTRGHLERIATPTGPVAVDGLLRLNEPNGAFLRENDPADDRWYSRDVIALSAARGLTVAPYFIDEGGPGSPTAAMPANSPATSSAPVTPVGGLTILRFHNSHLVYALTWYGLALMSVAAGVIVFRHERRRAARPPGDARSTVREDAGSASVPRRTHAPPA